MFLKILRNIYLILIFIFLVNTHFFSIEYFKGYSSNRENNKYSVASLLKTKYKDGSKWNENYFHEAQFSSQGITIFTNIIFSTTFIGKKGCKFNCIITFKNGERYSFNRDYGPDEFSTSDDSFFIKFGNNYIKLTNDNYKVYLNDNDVVLTLNYKIINPPQIFGDGIVSLDQNSFLSYSQPIIGAHVTGELKYKNENIALNGRGSIDHDYYSVSSPLKLPLKYRSFWFYDDNYSINLHTVIFGKKQEIDRLSIFRNGKLLKSFLNCGLKTDDFTFDEKSKFKYPNSYCINCTDNTGDCIEINIRLKTFTDKIMVFSNLSPIVHAIVAKTVGEMWCYRFWADGNFNMNINGENISCEIEGIGNYVDIVK